MVRQLKIQNSKNAGGLNLSFQTVPKVKNFEARVLNKSIFYDIILAGVTGRKFKIN
jgi:hypothetical protein